VTSWTLALGLAFALALPVHAQKPSKDGSDTYFQKGEIHDLRLVLAPEAEQALRDAPRAYAPFELWVDGRRFASGGGVKLKGAAGSYRDYDDRPALTVKLDKFDGTTLFHGLEKFHLNNAAQDPSLVSDWLGSEIFRAAGYPAVRVTHARVRLNERDMGLYVLKEGFDKRFLARWFADSKGNLYDGGFCQDLDAPLELDNGDGPSDGSDASAIGAACGESDMVKRWRAIEPLVEIPAFVRFMALEQLCGHWDGYTTNANNYRLYFVPGGKARFLPHGMDQLFGDPLASTLDMPTSLLGGSVMKRPEWRKLYRKELKELLPRIEPKALARKLDPVQDRIQAALKKVEGDAAAVQREHYQALVERIAERHNFLTDEVNAPEPKPLVFKPGVAVTIKGWRTHSEVEDARLESETDDGVEWYIVECGPSGRCIAGFRKGVLLGRGHYKFTTTVKADGVEALVEDGAPSRGAALRISGSTAESFLEGSGTRELSFEFEVAEEQGDVDLVLELRATAGRIRLRQDSLKLVKLGSK